MADLMEYRNLKYENKHFAYILIIIDCFTKYIWAKPIKKKDGPSCANALNDVFQDFTEWPNSLITDQGNEFYNQQVQTILKRYGIHHYSIKSKMKASIAERAIRTIKGRLHKCLVKNKTRKWIDYIDQIIENYNSTPHRAIKMAPKDVNKFNQDEVFATLYPDINAVAAPRLKIGNIVRIKIEKEIFEKGFTQNWSTKLYQVIDVRQRAGVVWYKIADLDGKRIDGIKYYYELNKVADNSKSLRTDE